MRDLYKKIGLTPSASIGSIKTAVEKIKNQRLKNDLETILLRNENKQKYDKAHRVLMNIGILRSQLGLNFGDNWNGTESNDFTKEDINPISQYEILAEKIKVLTRKKWYEYPIINILVDLVIRFSGILIFIGIIFIIFFISDFFSDEKPRSIPQKQIPEFSQPEVAFPYSGQIQSFSNKERIAPFEINTDFGTHYFVKLVDAYSDKDILTVFVRGGDKVQIDVPLGKFKLKYASGEKWYGYKYRFGPYTSYSKSNDIFDFKVVGNQVSGYTVTLYRVQDGNLRTYNIDASEF